MAKAKSERKTLSYEFAGSVLVVSDNDEIVRKFDFSVLPPTLNGKFLELGRKTKLANFAASALKEGRDRLDMMDEGWNLLKSGAWEFTREGGGPTISAEIEAIARLLKCSVGAAQKKLREYDEEARAKWLALPKVVEMAAQIREERAESPDLDELM